MSQPSPAPVPPPVIAAPRRKSKVKWLIIGGVVVLVAIGLRTALSKRGQVEIVPVTTDKAITKSITQLVTATGKVQPETEVKIAPEVGGEIIELPVREGASVKKGDLLLKIKPDNYKFAVEQQEASLASAKASAADSQARLVQAELDFKRNQTLYDQKLITDVDYANAKTSYGSAQAGYTSAAANITRSEGSLSQAKDALDKTVIYSPIEGKISSLTNELGERIAGTGSYGGGEVMRVADLDHMEIRVKVNENDIVNVKVGDHALISIDALPGRKFNGEVSEIANSAVAGTGADDVTNFLVKISITDHGVQLRPGMSATTDIETQTVKDVVAVPIQSVTVRAAGGLTSAEMQAEKAKSAKEKSGNDLAVVSDKDDARRERDTLQHVVFIRHGDTVTMQNVETGISDNTHIEVKKGLKAGDEVVSGSYTAISRKLKDASKITIEQPKTTEKK